MKNDMRVCNLYKYGIFDPKEQEQLAAWQHTEAHYSNPDPGCFVGIEVEVENTKMFDNLTLWTSTEDGSLRNNGLEYVSKPVRGKMIEMALRELVHALKSKAPKHEFSDRTSIHVHLNVRHMSVEQLANFILVYLALEPIFFKYTEGIPNSNRRENNYCVPIEDSKSHLSLLHNLGNYYHSKDTKWLKRLVEEWKKYTAFNLIPILNQGTVEFRHMGGTMDVPYIMTWINMILSMRKYVRTTPTEVIKTALFQLNTNSAYSNYLSAVLGTELNIPFDELLPLLEDSVASTKEIFAVLDLAEKEQISIEDICTSPMISSLNLWGIKVFHSLGASELTGRIDALQRRINSFNCSILEVEETNGEDGDPMDWPEDVLDHYVGLKAKRDDLVSQLNHTKAELEIAPKNDELYTKKRKLTTPFLM